MPTSYPLLGYKIKGQIGLYWGVEQTPNVTPGTAGTGTAGTAATTVLMEPCTSVTVTAHRKTYQDDEYSAFPAMTYDEVEMTHWGEVDIELPYRQTGMAERVLALCAGDIANTGASETVTGASAPYTHLFKVGPKGTITNTISLWVVEADTANVYQCLSGTFESIELMGTTDKPVMAKIKLFTNFPTVVAAVPTSSPIADYLDRALGFNCSFSIQNSAGGLYTAQPYSWNLTLSRKVEQFESNNQASQADPRNPYGFPQGPLTLEAGLDMIYLGMGAASPIQDFLSFAKLGTSAAPHSITWKDVTTNHYSGQVAFWPAKWTAQPKVTAQGEALKLTGGKLTSFQDRATAIGASPAYTAVSSITLTNSTSGGMIA